MVTGPGREALFASASVEEDHGQFTVVLAVFFPDGAVRHRLATYPSRQKAELAARVIERAAEREAAVGAPERT